MSAITNNSEYWSGHTKVEVEDYIKANIGVSNTGGLYYVVGTSSREGYYSSANTAMTKSTKWEASIPGITTATDGLRFFLRTGGNPGVAISSNNAAGQVLSIDGTNYYPVISGIAGSNILNQGLSVAISKDVTLLLVFNSVRKSTAYLTPGNATVITGCWEIIGGYN